MNQRKYSYAQLGMLFGLFVGGGLGTILFATTGNPVYFAIVGIGLALGLGLGAAYDTSTRSAREGERGSSEEESDVAS